MMKVVQESTSDEADHKPESRLKNCFESGRHKTMMSQIRSDVAGGVDFATIDMSRTICRTPLNLLV